MSAAPIPDDEAERLAVLRGLGIVDTPPAPAFDEIARLAAWIAKTPIALVTLIDEKRQWFKARVGVQMTETPRDIAFCAHAILHPDRMLIVPDTREDPRFADNPAVVGGPRLAFYAGAPLVVDDQAIGALCVIDRTPRELDPEVQDALAVLARRVEAQIVLERDLRRRTDLLARVATAEAEASRLARIVDEMPHGVLVFARRDAEAPFALVARNKAAIDRASHPANAELGRLARAFEPPAVGAILEARLVALAAGARPAVRTMSPAYDVSGRSFATDEIRLNEHTVALIIEDVTARIRFERSKDEFIAIAAHELRTPLAGMIGALGLMSAGAFGDLPPPAIEAATIAERSAVRLSRLTTDMLDLETMRQGRLALKRVETRVGELLDQTLAPLAASALQSGVTLVARGERDATLSIDRDRIVQALMNLVVNAIRHAPRDSEVVITATPTEDHVRFTIDDAGRGIKPDEQARLFDRFVQLEAPERRRHEGTGLGLAIVKGIVMHHGGSVGIESDPDARPGTRFWIELPRRG
jgi:signal transduction histidine kinase